MGMSSINWSKMLDKELNDEFKKKEEIMKKFKTKKAHELEVAIKVRKREAINA
jgi:hypothetical protein